MKGTEQPASLGSRAGSRWGMSEAEGARSTCEGLGGGGGSRLRRKGESKVSGQGLLIFSIWDSLMGGILTDLPFLRKSKVKKVKVVRIR